jgi:tetratricopeptide (TPR) repeat protein
MNFVGPIILFLVSAGLVGFVLFRKWRQVSLLNVDSIPAVKEQRKKEEILAKRIEIQAQSLQARLKKQIVPVVESYEKFRMSMRGHISRIEKEMMKSKRKAAKVAAAAVDPMELQQVLEGAHRFTVAKEWQKAEEAYIAILRTAPKNIEAYRGLAKVYYEQDQLKEAKETYQFVLHLDSQDDGAYAMLGDIAVEEKKYDEAVEAYQQAVLINPQLSPRFFKLADAFLMLSQPQTALEAIKQAVSLEPQNPKYLDSLVETAILCREAGIATEALQQLRMVNPENQKLVLFKEKISALV